jgi:hypothetical protein
LLELQQSAKSADDAACARERAKDTELKRVRGQLAEAQKAMAEKEAQWQQQHRAYAQRIEAFESRLRYQEARAEQAETHANKLTEQLTDAIRNPSTLGDHGESSCGENLKVTEAIRNTSTIGDHSEHSRGKNLTSASPIHLLVPEKDDSQEPAASATQAFRQSVATALPSKNPLSRSSPQSSPLRASGFDRRRTSVVADSPRSHRQTISTTPSSGDRGRKTPRDGIVTTRQRSATPRGSKSGDAVIPTPLNGCQGRYDGLAPSRPRSATPQSLQSRVAMVRPSARNGCAVGCRRSGAAAVLLASAAARRNEILIDEQQVLSKKAGAAFLVSQGAFNPVHRGHIHMLIAAKQRIEAEGYSVAAGFIRTCPADWIRKKYQSRAAPACPSCGKLMQWSKYGGGGYSNGWLCNNVIECGTESPGNLPRWYCPECQNDICSKCHLAPPQAAILKNDVRVECVNILANEMDQSWIRADTKNSEFSDTSDMIRALLGERPGLTPFQLVDYTLAEEISRDAFGSDAFSVVVVHATSGKLVEDPRKRLLVAVPEEGTELFSAARGREALMAKDPQELEAIVGHGVASRLLELAADSWVAEPS